MKTLMIRFNVVALAVLALITAVQPAAASGSYHYDFEAGSASPWGVVADPGAPTHSLSVQAGDSFGAGTQYAALAAGTPFMPQSGVWMYSRYPSRPGLPVQVTVRFAVKDEAQNCANCRAIAWIGDGWVSSSNAFTTVGPIAATTWTVYTFVTSVTPVSGAVGVAVGWRGSPSMFPTQVGYDGIDVNITP